MIRVAVADDHAIVRAGLRQILALMPDVKVMGEAANASEVLELVERHSLDLLLLDLNMPGNTGAALIARIRAQRPTLSILILSMHDEPQIAGRAIRAGANGYITKGCEPDALLSAIRRVAAGNHYIAPVLAEKMAFNSNLASQGLPHRLLSDREREVFGLLIQGKRVKEIASHLAVSNKTVSTHKVRLLEKMNLTSISDLMRYAVDHDLLN